MLKNLFIQNYAIIEELSLSFGPNLNIITGETGAGKSILTGALGLIQGNRADTKVLYSDDRKCIVEAEFDVDNATVRAVFAKEEMEFESPVVVRRMISPTGKSRAFVNDEPVNLKFLKILSAVLVDMHRQFDTLGINVESTQISMIDSLTKNGSLLPAYSKKFRQYRTDKNKLAKLIEEETRVKQELDFLEFQFKELDEAAFENEEQEKLENEVNVLQNADSIIQTLQGINYKFTEVDNSITDQVGGLRNELERIGDAGDEVEELLKRLSSVDEELRDIAFQSSSVAGNIEADPAKLEETNDRLSLLYRILQKHGKENLDELMVFQDDLYSKIQELRSFAQDRTSLEKSISELEKELLKESKVLHDHRMKVKPSFEKKVEVLLADLGMEHAKFEISITPSEELRNSGKDNIQFLFSANPGKSVQALNEVASGGELSRLALSLKSIVAGNIDLGTLIFDEIDTGISGDVSGKMGIILQKLAQKHQLISITHSPQIASKADTHFFIYKLVENQRTYTKVRELDEEGKVLEIAKMLSGDPPSDGAKKNAKELMEM